MWPSRRCWVPRNHAPGTFHRSDIELIALADDPHRHRVPRRAVATGGRDPHLFRSADLVELVARPRAHRRVAESAPDFAAANLRREWATRSCASSSSGFTIDSKLASDGFRMLSQCCAAYTGCGRTRSRAV